MVILPPDLSVLQMLQVCLVASLPAVLVSYGLVMLAMKGALATPLVLQRVLISFAASLLAAVPLTWLILTKQPLGPQEGSSGFLLIWTTFFSTAAVVRVVHARRVGV